MSNDIYGLLGIFFFFLAGIAASIWHILIGKNIIKNPMYDNEAKRKYILKLGIIYIIILSICAVFFLIVILFIV